MLGTQLAAPPDHEPPAPPPKEQPEGSEFIVPAKKLRKDPNAPKKPLSAFLYFSKEARPKLPEGTSFIEGGHELGRQWKSLSDEDKSPYRAQAEADKKRYAVDIESYQPDKAFLAKRKKASYPSLVKDPDRPKRGRTAYFVWCDETRDKLRKEFPKKTMGELSKLMSEGWKGCTEGEREQCEAKAAEEKIQYDAALEAYTPSETYKAAMCYVAAAKKVSNKKKKMPSQIMDPKKKEKMIAAKKRAKELSREIRDLEKTISTSSRLAESKKRELKKCEAIAGEKAAKGKAAAYYGEQGPGKKRKLTELQRKQGLVGKWVSVVYEGTTFSGQVMKYTKKVNKHTVRWIDAASDKQNQYECDALKANEYTILTNDEVRAALAAVGLPHEEPLKELEDVDDDHDDEDEQ